MPELKYFTVNQLPYVSNGTDLSLQLDALKHNMKKA